MSAHSSGERHCCFSWTLFLIDLKLRSLGCSISRTLGYRGSSCMITPGLLFPPPSRSILDECFVFSLMSFRSSAVLTTTPFWSGISWTSQLMASQRGGLPPAPTRILLDSRYKSCSYLSKTLLNVFLFRDPGLIAGSSAPLHPQVAPPPSPFFGGALGWLGDAASITERSLSLLLLSSSSLCPPCLGLLLLLACSDGPSSLCPLLVNDSHSHTCTPKGQHRRRFPTPEMTRLSQNVHLLLIYVL